MRVNVIQSTDKALIVVTMAEDEAKLLLGIAGFLGGGPIDDDVVDAMQKLENLLESGIEEIEQVIETGYPCEN